MKENRKQQLLREILDWLFCAVLAAAFALSVDFRIREVVNRTIETYQRDQQRTEWVKAARQATDTVPSLVIPGGGDGTDK